MISEINLKPMEILLVEDGYADARTTIFAVRLSQVHHRLTLVRTVSEAIAFLNQEGIFTRAPHPDLILLDLMLPDGNGLEVLEAMRAAEKRWVNTTTVVLTASPDLTLRDRCREHAVHDYMTKPINEEEFKRVIRDHKKLMVHTTPLLNPT